MSQIEIVKNEISKAIGCMPMLRELIESKGCGVADHGDRVSIIAKTVGERIGLSSRELDTLAQAALVHDIGKLGVPDRILNKAGRLTDAEFGVIQQHPEIGRDLLRHAGIEGDLLEIVLAHHERWDGEGYPFKKRGTEVTVAARILTISDSYDAMTHHRPYRAAQPLSRVLSELERCSGTQFDPDLVEVFLAMDHEAVWRSESCAA